MNRKTCATIIALVYIISLLINTDILRYTYAYLHTEEQSMRCLLNFQMSRDKNRSMSISDRQLADNVLMSHLTFLSDASLELLIRLHSINPQLSTLHRLWEDSRTSMKNME